MALRNFLNNCRRSFQECVHLFMSDNVDEDTVQSISTRLETMVRSLQWASGRLIEVDAAESMVSIVEEFLQEIQDIESSQPPAVGAHSYQSPLLRTGGVGQPRRDITVDQLNFLLSLNFTTRHIGEILGVSHTTIKNRLREFSISLRGRYSRISDAQLDEQIRQLTGANFQIGPEAVRSRLYADGIVVQRCRVRASMLRIDPEGAAYRVMSHRLQRRVYRVAGPNSLWHIDGNHKLIRWRIVIHGGIDGFSRLVVFLKASNNNRSATVMEHFVNATVEYGVPSRVRCDHGGENNAVCLFMEVFRGHGRGSAMRGRSTHNQRIERLWGDVWRGTVNVYHSLFTQLEDGLIDPINERHMWALHYVYLPRINRDLQFFVNQWNYHRLRTARYMSPYQIFARGCLAMQHRGLTGIREIFGNDADTPQGVAIDPPNPFPELQWPQEVVVPDSQFTVSEEHQQELQRQIDPLSGARDSLGIDVLQEVLGFLSVHYP